MTHATRIVAVLVALALCVPVPAQTPEIDASLARYTPLTVASGKRTVVPTDLNHVWWVSHCRGLVQVLAAV